MKFEETIKIIENSLSNQNIHINPYNYDGIIVKLLKTSNTLDSERSTNQTHIAITGNQMDIFPTIENVGYLNSEKPDSGLKKFFLGKIDVYLSNNNIKYLSNELTPNNENNFIKSDTVVIKSVRSDSTRQIQLSLLDKDDKKFILFRRLLHENYVLIVLKRKESLEYEFYGLKPEEYTDEIKKLNNNFFHSDKNTLVNMTEAYLKEHSDTEKSKVIYKSKLKNEKSRNRIIFGAPGTGKSFKLNDYKDDILKSGGEYERVTFHPDYSYANFVGTYKPVPTKDIDGKDSITYKYVPGPFLRTYIKAIKNCIKVSKEEEKPKPYLLLIEEINRANTASVFGDIFQLLDRKDNISEYPIHTSEDMKKYLADEIGLPIEEFNEIKLPDNMFIWATMNSADQGVFPMDTAFKRRWSFEYLDIDNNDFKIEELYVDILGQEIKWNSLRKSMNIYLADNGVNEDKLIGPFFINVDNMKEAESSLPSSKPSLNKDKFEDVFKDKVLMYLFEDAAKHTPDIFSGCSDQERKRFSRICKAFDSKGINIFDKSIVENIKKGFI